MRTVELCGRPSPRPLPGLRSASGSPRACLWFTRYHNRLRAAQSSVRLYRVLKSQSINLLCENRVHGTVLFCRMADGACRCRRRVGLGVVSRPGYSAEHPRRFSPHTLKHFTSERLSALAAQRGAGEHFLQYFYSSTRVSQRPPVAVHVHVIAELLARACHVTCARTPRFRPPRPAVRVFRTFRDSVASGSDLCPSLSPSKVGSSTRHPRSPVRAVRTAS